MNPLQNKVTELEAQVQYLQAELEKISRIAYRDELTGLYNRRKFTTDYEEILQNKQNLSWGLLYLDLNDLKKANDTLGHKEGDKLICLLSENIRQDYDKSYRIGGDEFIVLISQVTPQELGIVIERLKTNFKESKINVSFGVYHSSEPINKSGSPIEIAEKRMYIEKNEYKNIKKLERHQ